MAEPRRTIGKGGNFRTTKSGAGMTEKAYESIDVKTLVVS